MARCCQAPEPGATTRQEKSGKLLHRPLAEPAGLSNDGGPFRTPKPMTDQPRDTPQFFLTSPSPCPYLPGRQERKVFTHLVGKRAFQLNEILTQGGFRRSQSIAYRPACEACRACVSVRVLVNEFEASRNFRRIMARNADLSARMISAQPTAEQYGLFRAYLDARHADGGMVDMSVLDYAAMIEDSHVETRLVEYRTPQTGRAGSQELVGVALTDILSDGLSMVYSFYDPDQGDRSLGTFLILDHIAKAKASGLPYLYLGYWVEGSRKMDYKARFLPQERLGMLAWDRVSK
jgi:arginyl-tRNA--protein-N-Asp/Glu arginylyltransferase